MISEKMSFVYAEQTPVDDQVPATGLCRAGVPILKAIADRIAMIAIYPQDRRFGLASMHPALRPLCRRLPRPFSWFRPLRKRLLPDDFENGAVARIAGRWADRSGISHVLCLEGSDPEVLARVDAIAAWAGRPFSVYLVDDFACTLRQHGHSEADIAATMARMQKSLLRAHRVFAITDELGALLHRQFGITATTLKLAFEPRIVPRLPRRDQIFFLGSINFLYLDALRTLLEIVARLRAQTGRDITVRFTHAAPTGLNPLPDFVKAAPIADADALAEEIAASLFAFLPYTFESHLRVMVETSFPSKSMEYLAYARSIVVYAPDYSNSAHFFRKAGLPVVTVTPELLEAEILRQLGEPPDYAAIYRAYLAKRHSLQAARAVLLSALSNDDTS
jgi:hypothetical protein